MAENEVIICYKCQQELTLAKTYLSYLGQSFSVDIPRCPECGQVYIPEDLAKGRMLEVEKTLEDK